MDERETRALVAAHKIRLALVRAHPELTDSALDFLADAASKTAQFEHHLRYGDPLELAEVLGAAERSDAGQLIFADRAEEGSGPVDHVAATREMSPQDRINYARAHGLR